MRPFRVGLTLAGTVLVVAACTASSAATTPSTAGPLPTLPPTTQTTQPPVVVDWDDSSVRTPVGGGWVVTACIGDAAQLCVEKDEVHIGVVTAAVYPIDPTYEDPLVGFAERFLTDFADDRAAGCGPDYGFEPFLPEAFGLGGGTGLAFGFEGTMPDGSESELVLQFASRVDERIVSVAAIGDADEGCLGRDEFSSFRPAELAAFRPYLEAVLQATPLPVFEPVGG